MNLTCSICEKRKADFLYDGWTICRVCLKGYKKYPDPDMYSFKRAEEKKKSEIEIPTKQS